MTRINSNIPSLIAQSNLRKANSNLNVRLERLATGLRINKGADDPAGLIISERLRAEISGIEQGIKNTDRASNVIATTEGALSEVSQLLNSIKALVVEASNTGAFSPEELEANQRSIDSAIDSITRISNTATSAGSSSSTASWATAPRASTRPNYLRRRSTRPTSSSGPTSPSRSRSSAPPSRASSSSPATPPAPASRRPSPR